jgi:hypothetical protein
MEDSVRRSLIPLVLSLKVGSADRIVDALSQARPNLPQTFDRIKLTEELREDFKEARRPISYGLSRTLSISRQHGLPPASEYIRLLKGLMSFEGTARELNPRFDFEKFAIAEVMRGAL